MLKVSGNIYSNRSRLSNPKIICKVLEILSNDDDEALMSLILEQDVKQIFIPKMDKKFPRIFLFADLQDVVCFLRAIKCFDSLTNLDYDFNKPNHLGLYPIHYACAGGSIEIIRRLETSTKIYEVSDSFGMTPIHYAAMFGNITVFQYLFAKGVSMEYIDSGEHYPVYYAAKNGFLDIVKFIFEATIFSGDIRESIIQDTISVALKNCNVDIADYLIKSKNVVVDEYLLECAASADLQTVRYILKYFCFDKPQEGKTFMSFNDLKYLTVRHQSVPLLQYIFSQNPDEYFDKEAFNTTKSKEFTKILALHYPVEYFRHIGSNQPSLFSGLFKGMNSTDLVEIYNKIEEKSDRKKVLDLFLGQRSYNLISEFLQKCFQSGEEISLSSFKKELRTGYNIKLLEPVFDKMMSPQLLSSLCSFQSIEFVFEHMDISKEDFEKYEILEKIINSDGNFLHKRPIIVQVIEKYHPDMISMLNNKKIKNKNHLVLSIFTENPYTENKEVLNLADKFKSKSETDSIMMDIVRLKPLKDMFNSIMYFTPEYIAKYMDKFTMKEKAMISLKFPDQISVLDIPPDTKVYETPFFNLLRSRNKVPTEVIDQYFKKYGLI